MRFMRYADDSIWLLFILGLGIILGALLSYVELGLSIWAVIGFVGTGLLVAISYYVVGTHPPKGDGAEGRGDRV